MYSMADFVCQILESYRFISKFVAKPIVVRTRIVVVSEKTHYWHVIYREEEFEKFTDLSTVFLIPTLVLTFQAMIKVLQLTVKFKNRDIVAEHI